MFLSIQGCHAAAKGEKEAKTAGSRLSFILVAELFILDIYAVLACWMLTFYNVGASWLIYSSSANFH